MSDLQSSWDEQLGAYRVIKERGAQAYANGIADLAQAFELQDRTLRCIDEGTPGGIHLAGQGILMDTSGLAEFCAKAKLDGVVSHDECGACGIYAKRKGLDTADTDGYGKVWTAKVAEICAVPVKGHVEITDMARPSGHHIARVAYYDGTGSFDPSRVPAFPPGFVISRAYLDAGYAGEEVKISANIAMGAHGFGERIAPENPFYFIAVARKNGDGVPLETLLGELRTIAAEFGGKVAVDSFTV